MKISKKQMEKFKDEDDAINDENTAAQANKKKFNWLQRIFSREGAMLDGYLNYIQEEKCPTGHVWCPMKKECIPEEEMKSMGHGKGKGAGPIGVPSQEGRIAKLKEAGFTDKPEGWTDKSIKKYTKTFTSKMKGDAKSKGFFDKCVEKMKGKMENPEGFCASLKDESYGSTHWRGKDKSKKQATKDVRAHKNV